MKPELPLRDIHLPTEPSWWPPAPGWWLLAAIGMAFVVFLLISITRRARQASYRRRILQSVDKVWRENPQQQDGVRILSEWTELLRRACLRHRPELAAQDGLVWIEGLGLDSELTPDARQVLLEGAYRRTLSRDDVATLQRPLEEALKRLLESPIRD